MEINEQKIDMHLHLQPLAFDRPRTIYAYDVSKQTGGPFLANRRVFALVDFGIPDGVQTDQQVSQPFPPCKPC
jgi:hypothetical protein